MNWDRAFSKFIADASALVALGAVACVVVGRLFHSSLDDARLSLWGSVVGFLVATFWTCLSRRYGVDDLLVCLTTADALFIRGVINEDEWLTLRLTGIQRLG